MRPCSTAARSAAPMVTETHVAPVPASNGAMEDTRPPPPGAATSAPSGSKRKESGPRVETTMQSPPATGSAPTTGSAVATGSAAATGSAGGAGEGGTQHVGGLRAQLVQ